MEMVNTSPNAQKINQEIKSLKYNPDEILAFSGDSITSYIPRTGQMKPDEFIVVTKTKHTVTGSFDIAVPNARRDITFPGALLIANQKLVEGVPNPLVVAQSPRKLTIDLPGLTDDNSIVPKTMDYAGVSAAINSLTNHWLKTKASTFSIPANTEFRKNILYNENEMALNFGVDVTYLKGSLGLNFDSISKQESSAYLVMFRQIFYTVSVEQPLNPADVFADEVKWADLKDRINDQNPPAYVQNVQYGREVFVLLRSSMSSSQLKGHLDATLEFNNGKVHTTDDAATKALNKQIDCTVITIGGKPVVINGNLDQDNILDRVNELLGTDVDFTPNNPAMPLVYTTTFLKNNFIAHIQGNTDYITTDTQVFHSGSLTLHHKAGYVAIFYVDWEEVTFDAQGNEIVTPKKWDGSGVWRTLGFTTEISMPPNVRNIHIKILDETGLAWDPWWVVMDKILAPLGKRDVTIWGTTLSPSYEIKPADPGVGVGYDPIATPLPAPQQDYVASPHALGMPEPGKPLGANSFLPGDKNELRLRLEMAAEALKEQFSHLVTFDDILNPTPLQKAIAEGRPIAGVGPDAKLLGKIKNSQKTARAPGNAPATFDVPLNINSGHTKEKLPKSVGTSGAGAPSGANDGGQWFKFDGQFYYKEMKYMQSCFPCSVHTNLANLGYLQPVGNEIEDLWNKFHGDLNKTAPNEEQIHSYLSRTPELGRKGVVYTPMHFKSREDADAVRAKIQEVFLNARGPSGLVAGIGHAEVFYKTKFGRYIHFKPSPEHESIECEYIMITGLSTLDGGGGEFALGIHYYIGEERTAQAAHFVMHIS